jgi:Flp pilus assembly protein CpaB
MKIRYVIVVAFLAFLTGAAVSAGVLLAVLWPRLTGSSVAVLQARHGLVQWTTLHKPDETFQIVYMPRQGLAPGVIAGDAVHDVKGRRLRQNLRAGELLTEDHLLAREVTGLAQTLKPGEVLAVNKYVVNVPLTADKAVSFFVVPGSRVDVTQNKGGKSTVLLRNVLVLAIPLCTAAPDDRPGLVGGPATLLVDSAEDAAKLADAAKNQPVSLIMLPPADAANGEKPAPQPIPPPPPPFLEDK